MHIQLLVESECRNERV